VIALVERIRQHEKHIRESFHVGDAQWDALLGKIEHQEKAKHVDFYDEQVWTFLVGCAYAIHGLEGTTALAQILIEGVPPSHTKAWFEVMPLPPRIKEGRTHLDLAVGSLKLRHKTQGGIELASAEDDWVCFVECKWYSDIAGSVSHDKHRNQLARIIENAVYFGKGDRFAHEVHVTLVTPEIFKSYPVKSRLYQYKYSEYSDAQAGAQNLITDLSASSLVLRRHLPDIRERLHGLHLHWVTYETLFQQAPDAELKLSILEFGDRFNATHKNQASK
jgi:hypothetical protein